ncbi:NAD(P)-binding protein [Xylariaceae sp. AK1471]|nr:NAD(P)-binding protein [Xylariaceae sp. AK1471]
MDFNFDISPEKRASKLHFFYRQLFVNPHRVPEDASRLLGKTAIVTGANGGLGLESARQLLNLGCRVILAVRDIQKGEQAREKLARGASRSLEPDSICIWELDLASYDSCIRFADRAAKQLKSLNFVILNAGVFKVHESFAPTGYEESVQINYLSTMLLAVLLLSVVAEKRDSGTEPGHIVIVTSDTSAWVKFDERHSVPLLPAFKAKVAKWDMAERYGTSKLLCQLFLTELARKVPPSQVVVSCANPGFCRGSDLGRQAGGLLSIVYAASTYLLGRRCAVGARTYVHAAVVLGEESHGQYVEDAKIQPMPPLVYTSEGRRIAKLLFEETLDELSFVGLRQILERLK